MVEPQEFQDRVAQLERQYERPWQERLRASLELLTGQIETSAAALLLLDNCGQPQSAAELGQAPPAPREKASWNERFGAAGLTPLPETPDGWALPIPAHAPPLALLFFTNAAPPAAPALERDAALLAPLLHTLSLECQHEKEQDLARRYQNLSESLKRLDAQAEIPEFLEQIGQLAERFLEADRILLFSFLTNGKEDHYCRGFSPTAIADLQQCYRTQHEDERLTQEALFHTPDASAGPEALANVAARENFHTLLSLPFQVPERPLGVLLLARDTVRPFTPQEISLTLTFVNQASLALNNAYLFHKERAQRELSQALAEAASALTRTLDLDQVLDEILEQLQRVVPHDASNIMLIEDDHTRTVRWRGYETFGCVECVQTAHFSLQTPNMQQMIRTRAPLAITDTRENPQWIPSPGLEWLRSHAAAPITINGEVVGFINADSQKPGFFNKTHAQHLKAFADYATIALKNARFFEESQKRQAYLEGLNAVISAVNQAPGLDEILQLGLARALQIAEMERGGLYLWDPRDELLHLRVHQGLSDEVVKRVAAYHSGEGLTGKAFAERRSILAPNVATTRPDLPEDLQHFIKAQISLPLIVEGQAVGVMSLNRPHGRELPPEAEQLLRAIADQLAVAVQRGQLTLQLQEQLSAVHQLYETSAALLVQTSTRGALFLLLRTLTDLLQESAIGAAFYRLKSTGWERARVYTRKESETPQALWTEGPPWEGETALLELCDQKQHVLRITALDVESPAYWQEITALRGKQVLYIPLHLPNSDNLGVVALLLRSEEPLSSQHYAPVMALIQQGTATLTRVRLYEQSVEAENRLRAILESSQDGILLVGEGFKMRYINRRALELLSLSGPQSEWETNSLPAVISAIRAAIPELAHWLARSARQMEKLPPALLGEQVIPIFKTVKERQIQVYHWPVYAQHDELQGSLFLLRDVTEQKALERMRDDLLHMLVHDMRNPLSIIQNALQIIDDPAMHASTPQLTNLALRNTDRLLTLVNAILDIGRIESGRFELRQGVVALPQIIHTLETRIAVASDDTVFEVNVPSNLPKLWADPDVLERIFHNLIDNAFKFIPRKSGIIRINATLEGKWVKIEVYNNGKPIPEDVKARLFEKFSAGEYRGQGYGLGLAFCRLAVEAHGGKIYPENHPDGVSFFFTLPIAAKSGRMKDEE